ncbi:MFS transporter [Chloroflexota bacterium]
MSSDIECQDPADGRFFYGWVIALCCTLITVINGGIFMSFGVFFKPVALDFGWSRGEFAGNYTAMLLAYAPAALLAGRLADRRGPRPILLLAALLIVFGFIGCSLAPNMVWMTLSYVTMGLGLGATLALPLATIQHWFLRWRGTMVGIVAAGTGIGGFIFTPLVNFLIALYDWRAAYLIIGVVSGGVTAVSAAFLIAEPKMKKLRPFGSREKVLDSYALFQEGTLSAIKWEQVSRLGAFWGMATLHILYFMPTFFINSHLVPYVTDRGISAATGAQGLGLMAGMSVVGRLAMSWLAGRIGWMKSLTISYFVASICIIWLIFVAEPEAFYLFAVIYGFSGGSIIALLGGAIGFFFGLSALSQLLGFLLGLGVLGGAIAPFLGGLSFDLTGSYLTAMATTAFFLAAAGLLCVLLRPSR